MFKLLVKWEILEGAGMGTFFKEFLQSPYPFHFGVPPNSGGLEEKQSNLIVYTHFIQLPKIQFCNSVPEL